MDSASNKMSSNEVLRFLIQLWHAIRDRENVDIVKWVKGGRVFKIVDIRRFYSEVCPDLCDECTPAYFEYFMISCGFETIPPQFIDYYHENFLQNDYSRIERIKPICSLLKPEVYNYQLDETSEYPRFNSIKKETSYQSTELKDELNECEINPDEEIWPDPEGLPESPLIPEAADLSSDYAFYLNTFPSEMLSDHVSILASTQSSSLDPSACSDSLEPQETNAEEINLIPTAISLKDLKSSFKLNLIRCISSDSADTDVSQCSQSTSKVPEYFYPVSRGMLDLRTDFKSNPWDFSQSNDETDSDSIPSSPDSILSPNVSPLRISKLRDYPLIYDPMDPFNLFYYTPVSSMARTWSTPLTPSPPSDSFEFIPFSPSKPPTSPDSTSLEPTLLKPVPLDSQTLSNLAPRDISTIPNSSVLDAATSSTSRPRNPQTLSSSPSDAQILSYSSPLDSQTPSILETIDAQTPISKTTDKQTLPNFETIDTPRLLITTL